MLEIVGYADRMAVRQGETIAFKVSCEGGARRYRADIVRLRCGDDRPGGPGFREQAVDASVNGTYAGRRQAIDCGSYAVVPCGRALDGLRSFALAAFIWPTLPGVGAQTIMGRWRGARGGGAGYALGLDAAGCAVLHLGRDGAGPGDSWQLTARRPLQARRWYRLLASFDATSGEALLHYQALDNTWGDPGTETCRAPAPFAPEAMSGQPFTLAAHLLGAAGEAPRSAGHFNGRIEAPRIAASAVAPDEVEALLGTPGKIPLAAAWDFAQGIPTTVIRDIGPNRLHGRLINLPARAVTGHGWSGRSASWREAPADYAAIHFHEDDLYDCAWRTDFAWRIPAHLPSGASCRGRLRRGSHPLLRPAGPRWSPGAGRLPRRERHISCLCQQP